MVTQILNKMLIVKEEMQEDGKMHFTLANPSFTCVFLLLKHVVDTFQHNFIDKLNLSKTMFQLQPLTCCHVSSVCVSVVKPKVVAVQCVAALRTLCAEAFSHGERHSTSACHMR